MKVTIKFPVLCVDTKEVDLTDEEIETLKNPTNSDTAAIIEKYLTHDELGHVPGSLEDALEYDYAAIIFHHS